MRDAYGHFNRRLIFLSCSSPPRPPRSPRWKWVRDALQIQIEARGFFEKKKSNSRGECLFGSPRKYLCNYYWMFQYFASLAGIGKFTLRFRRELLLHLDRSSLCKCKTFGPMYSIIIIKTMSNTAHTLTGECWGFCTVKVISSCPPIRELYITAAEIFNHALTYNLADQPQSFLEHIYCTFFCL